ncbi:MAG: hypothetical protein NT145_03895 [Elusimicrobia bacterium]|nr:hypothetical protein [Elusimicrobiota bacterium]
MTNLSKTYVWVSTPVPFTEQYQYTGDPRHCPYTDVKQSGGYNWYFRQVADNALRYAGFANTANGYAHTANGAKVCDVDVPRTFLTFREGLLKNTAIWSAINGWSYYYFGLGGEFGADQTPFTNSIYFVETPWVAASAAINNVNEICNWNAPNIVYNRLVSKTDNSWYARFWLGELYPDGFFNIWTGSGNLPTGAGNFYRQNYNGIADLNFQRESSIGEEGCASFYNNGSDTSHFMHVGIGGPNTNGVIQAPGNRIMDTFGIPLLSPVSSVRPFLINSGSPDPVEINNAVYSGANKTALTVMQQFYNDTASGSRNTAAMVRMVKGTDTCYTSVAGFETTANFGTSQIGRFALASVMQTFLEGGLNTGQDHIPQIPYVDLTSPGVSTTLIDPINIGIQWNLSWNKWDGQKYTALYPNGYTETTPVVYILKYSNDGGSKWRYCTDGTAAQAGKRSATHETTSTSYTWPASGLSRGTYIIRVECFRTNINQHYSYDQVSVYIQK